MSTCLPLVPVFDESYVEAFFIVFERVATALYWPEDVWTLLLQHRLIGKAQDVFSFLPVGDLLNYGKVKNAILSAYGLVPKAYRQRFMTLRKLPHQTFVGFAREKERLFDKWCQSSKATDFSLLRELMLLEAFENCVPDSIKEHLDEHKVTSLPEAAVLAEEFAMNHKGISVGKCETPAFPPPKWKSDRKCFYCHKVGHLVAYCLALKHSHQISRQKKKGAKVSKVSSSVSFTGNLEKSPPAGDLLNCASGEPEVVLEQLDSAPFSLPLIEETISGEVGICPPQFSTPAKRNRLRRPRKGRRPPSAKSQLTWSVLELCLMLVYQYVLTVNRVVDCTVLGVGYLVHYIRNILSQASKLKHLGCVTPSFCMVICHMIVCHQLVEGLALIIPTGNVLSNAFVVGNQGDFGGG